MTRVHSGLMTRRGSEPRPHLHRLRGHVLSQGRTRETFMTEGAQESTVA